MKVNRPHSEADQKPLVKEWTILLAGTQVCHRDEITRRLRSLLDKGQDKPVDWDAILTVSDQHGVSPLLCRNLTPLEDRIPRRIMLSFEQRCDSNVRKSLFLARELIRILDCADSLGIEVISYKGITLADTYYEDMALRQTGDIDLFVREKDVLRMKAALIDLGFAPHAGIPAGLERSYIKSGYEWGFASPAGQNVLELQWRLQPRFYAVDYDMDGLFTRAVQARIADHILKVPAPDDLLIVLSLHAAKHLWGRLIWLCDIAQILRSPNLNWDWIQARTRELGIVRILHITLILMNQLLGGPIPSAMQEKVCNDRQAHALAEEIARAMPTSLCHEEAKLSYFRLMMNLRERPIDRLRFFSRLAFTPGPGEWKALPLPNSLAPLYRIVRLGRLATRFARGSM